MLYDKISNPPRRDFRLLLLLPSKPNSGADDTRGVLGHLIEADADAGRLLACTLYARAGHLHDPIYVHAKVAIVDDDWLTLGSANLNEHSLFNDTEMNIVSHDPELARETRLRLWAEHLELPIEEIPSDPIEAIDDLWKPISKDQLERRDDGRAAHPSTRPATERLEPLRPRTRPGHGPPRRRVAADRGGPSELRAGVRKLRRRAPTSTRAVTQPRRRPR